MKLKKLMLYIIILIVLIATILIVGKINLSIRFNKQVKQLFADSKNISDKKYEYSQIESLPEPVQRYFRYVLKEGQPYISSVRIIHEGQFKTDLKKDWVKITGEEYFTTEKPGFIWKGNTATFTARDMYLEHKGRLVVSLFSLVNVVNVQGEQYNQGELLRWLGESVWFPTNLLPNENLKWTPIDNQSAKINFNYEGLYLFFIVTFNKKGEITQMQTKRYMDEKNLETWIIKPSDYKTINGVLIPTKAEVAWRLNGVDYSYAKFNIIKIEYEKPENFK